MSRRTKNRLFNSKNASAKALLMRRLLIWSGISIAVVILLLIIAWYQTLAYLQGSSFRQTLEQHITDTTGAKQVIIRKNLHIDGERVSEEEIQIRGLQELESADIGRLSVELDRGALWDRRLHLKKVLMEEASFSFVTEEQKASTGKAKKPASAPAKKADKPVSAKKPQDKSAPEQMPQDAKEDSHFTIREYLLDYLECNDLDIRYKKGDKEYSLAGSTVKATPISGSKNKRWQLNLENGRVHLPFSFLRDTSIRNAYLTYNGRSINMSECRFMLTPGEMSVKAHYNCQNTQWQAELHVNKADIDRLLHDDWKKRITGELFGKATMTGTAGSIERMDGLFSLRQGVLEGLPILSELRIGNTRPYRTIRLSKADCRVSYPYNNAQRNLEKAWLIDKIDVRAEGASLRIRGHIIIADDKSLGGTLTFGIPAGTLSALPIPSGITEKLFNAKGEAGYVWVNMNLSGTLDEPEEDLSVRLTTILQSTLPNVAGQAASAILDTLFNVTDTTEPKEQEGEESQEPTPKKDIIQQTTESAGDLIKGGMRLFF